jgi:hypothetical protein
MLASPSAYVPTNSDCDRCDNISRVRTARRYEALYSGGLCSRLQGWAFQSSGRGHGVLGDLVHSTLLGNQVYQVFPRLGMESCLQVLHAALMAQASATSQ